MRPCASDSKPPTSPLSPRFLIVAATAASDWVTPVSTATSTDYKVRLASGQYDTSLPSAETAMPSFATDTSEGAAPTVAWMTHGLPSTVARKAGGGRTGGSR